VGIRHYFIIRLNEIYHQSKFVLEKRFLFQVYNNHIPDWIYVLCMFVLMLMWHLNILMSVMCVLVATHYVISWRFS